MNAILGQLARSGLLWDDKMIAAILSGDMPPLESIVTDVVISCMDAEATVRNDATSTLSHRRIARLCLAVAFLGAIACTKEKERPL